MLNLKSAASLGALVALVLVAALSPATASAASPQVAYRLSPVRERGEVKALAVEVRYRADKDGHGDFEWARSWAGDGRLWRWARGFHVVGARSVEDLGEGRWRIRGRPNAPLVVRYRVTSAFDHDPTIEDGNVQPLPIIRPRWFYVVGEALFGRPTGSDDKPAAFDWTDPEAGFAFASDLQHLAGAHRAAARPGTVADILESVSLGGADVRVLTGGPPRSALRVAVRGDFTFSPEDFDRLARTIISTERAFWRDGEEPFLVTLAPLQAHASNHSFSGTGRTDAFAVWYDTALGLQDLKWLLAHEYFHTWNARQLGGLRNGDEIEPLGYWFSEGFTDYYARRLTLASGEWTLEDFAASWNAALKAYDLSPKRAAANAALPSGFWTDPDLHQLPYQRGAVLAALLDARLRSAHPGGAGLDEILRAQRAEAGARAGGAGSDASLLFREELRRVSPGLDAVVEAAAVRGEGLELPEGAFAPCFRVKSEARPTFDRGFDLGATIKNGRHVVGLSPNGPAARAGLRSGDLISIDESTEPDPSVRRTYVVHEPGGGAHTISFLPEGPPAAVQQLELVSGLSASQRDYCARLFGSRG